MIGLDLRAATRTGGPGPAPWEKFGVSFETFGTSHGAAQALYSTQGFMSARSDLRNPAGAGSDTVPTMRRDDDDSQS